MAHFHDGSDPAQDTYTDEERGITFGPWQSWNDGHGSQFVISAGDPDDADCVVHVKGPNKEKRAQLIAAAPALRHTATALNTELHRVFTQLPIDDKLTKAILALRAAIVVSGGF